MELCKLPHVYLAKDHATMLPIISRHNVLQNRPLVQKLHCASLRKNLVMEILQQNFFAQQNDDERVPIAEISFPESIETDDSSIEAQL
jgi:hypothetical protein